MDEEEIEKIHVNLPNHWAIAGESMWATPLGNDLFRIENVPFYAYGLNYQDIVRAIRENEGPVAEIKEVVRPSGHRTFRVYFEDKIDREKQERTLKTFEDLHVEYERCNDFYFSLDMRPEGNYQTVFDKLEGLEKKKVLGFETCESRLEGSFDDLPEKKE